MEARKNQNWQCGDVFRYLPKDKEGNIIVDYSVNNNSVPLFTLLMVLAEVVAIVSVIVVIIM